MLWHGPRLVRTVFTENTRTEENSEPLGRRKQFRRPYVTDMALELICQPANPSNVSKLCQYETAENILLSRGSQHSCQNVRLLSDFMGKARSS